MSVWEAAFLGVIQGLTEFLPVSSSGHLVLFGQLIRTQTSSLLFEIVVHLGTLVAVIIVFWQEVLLLVKAFFKLIIQPRQAKILLYTDPSCNLLWLMILATLPLVVFAILFKSLIENLFTSSLFVGFALLLTGAILALSERTTGQKKGLSTLSNLDAVVIGLAQAFAVLPGISRSGTTIALGLICGLDRESAARFSFLLSIPAILGALVYSLGDLLTEVSMLQAQILVTGFVVAALTGYVAIRVLLKIMQHGKLIWFAYYTWLLGILVILLSLI